MIFPDFYESKNYSEIIFLSYFFEYGFYSAQQEEADIQMRDIAVEPISVPSGNSPPSIDPSYAPRTRQELNALNSRAHIAKRKVGQSPDPPPAKRTRVVREFGSNGMDETGGGAKSKTRKKHRKQQSNRRKHPYKRRRKSHKKRPKNKTQKTNKKRRSIKSKLRIKKRTLKNRRR